MDFKELHVIRAVKVLEGDFVAAERIFFVFNISPYSAFMNFSKF